ncbi:MAG: FAD-dependent oxidoreductase [Burkholderiales bacterium]
MNTFSSPDSNARALIIGASIAGLLAARVLSEHYREVVLLERDELPEGAAPRKGTPHALHPHGLLARGRQVLEELFPGLTDALVAQGARAGDLLADAVFNAGRHRFAQGRCGIGGIVVSRLLLEAELRRRVLSLTNVRAMTGSHVRQPVLDEASQRVVGVSVSRSDGDTTVPADLAVDCTGRASRTPSWLEGWGYAAPEEDRVTVGLRYTTAYFARPQPMHGEPNVVICSATPLQPRPGVLLAQEPAGGGPPRWVLGVGGYAGDHPGGTLEAVRERTRTMGCEELMRVCRDNEPIGALLQYEFPFSQRRRYEQLERFPSNYLVLGDALASFNPIYGQGMTVTVCQALALRDALRSGDLAALRRRFFAAAAKLIDTPWQLAVGADLALPFVAGPRSVPQRLIDRYIARLHRAAVHDARVALAFLKVVHLLEPPSSLFAPAVALRVLLRSGRSIRSDGLPPCHEGNAQALGQVPSRGAAGARDATRPTPASNCVGTDRFEPKENHAQPR